VRIVVFALATTDFGLCRYDLTECVSE